MDKIVIRVPADGFFDIEEAVEVYKRTLGLERTARIEALSAAVLAKGYNPEDLALVTMRTSDGEITWFEPLREEVKQVRIAALNEENQQLRSTIREMTRLLSLATKGDEEE